MSCKEQERRADILNTMYRTLDWRECYQEAVKLAEERDRERLYQKTGLEFFAPKKRLARQD